MEIVTFRITYKELGCIPDQLGNAMRVFFTQELEAEVGDDSGKIALRRALPDHWPLVIAGCMQNLRSAGTAKAFVVAKAHDPACDPAKFEFPVAPTTMGGAINF